MKWKGKRSTLKNQPGNHRVKRHLKNMIVFLQINENIGPLTVFKDQMDSLRDNDIFCDVELFDSGSDTQRKMVYKNRVKQKLGDFDDKSQSDDSVDDQSKDDESTDDDFEDYDLEKTIYPNTCSTITPSTVMIFFILICKLFV